MDHGKTKQAAADPLPTRTQALDTVRRALDRDGLARVATVPSHQAAGLVSAGAVRAVSPSPTAHVSTRDGMALAGTRTRAATPEQPVILAPGRDFHRVNTGWKLPPDTDAVVPLEDAALLEDGRIALARPLRPGRNVRPLGEDLAPGDVVLGPGSLITPVDVGGLLTAGIFEVAVYEPVRLAFISTGDEILHFRDRPVPNPGQVIESNARVFCSLAASWGASAESVPPIKDDPQALERAVRLALEDGAQVVAVGAGTSYSDKDFSRTVFPSLGRVLVGGLAMVPGRPGILAEARGRLLAGVPGNPAGALAFLEEILGPLVCWLGRRPEPHRREVEAVMACSLAPRPGMERLVRVGLARVDRELTAVPVDRISGLVRTLSRSAALLRVPADSPGYGPGQKVRLEITAPHLAPERCLPVLGIRSRALDVLGDELLARGHGCLAFARTSPDEALDGLSRGRALAASLPRTPNGAPKGCRAYPLDADTLLAVPASRQEDTRILALLDLLDSPPHSRAMG